VVARRERASLFCARVALDAPARGRTSSPLGGSSWPSRGSRTLSVIERLVVAVEQVVEINFGVHVPLDQVASLVTGFSACGLVRALDDTQRNYAVTVRRAGAMEYLETQLARGERQGWFAWRLAAP
jgi:hypothetical protein